MSESLTQQVTQHFSKRKASCIKNVLILAQCIILKETICLNRLKGAVNIITGKVVKADSNYKRLIRIFDNYSFSSLWLELLKFVFSLLHLKSEYLLLDGTKWKRGKKWYHYQTLCIIYKGVAIPIYWMNIKKRGISNYGERKTLLKRAIRYFNLSGKTLIADREYIGVEWFKLLINSTIDFAIRTKKNTYVEAVNQAYGKTYQQMIDKVLRSKIADKAISKVIELDGVKLLFVVVKNPKNDPKEPVIFLLSSQLHKPAKSVAMIYCKRYKIEHCFKHLKSNGFNLEQINLRTPARCRLLMAITVFAYVLSIHEGLKDYKKVSMKIYAEGQIEKSVSIFRNGIDQLMVYCTGLERFCQYLIDELVHKLPRYKSPFSINV